MAAPTGTSGQGIVDDFENSFQACLAALTNPDHFNVRDSEEVKTGVEQTIQRFLDLAKQMECFFLQKRLLLSTQKPEQFVIESAYCYTD
ncbi:mediator of RNA polymerase II transcription subunit 28-like [Limulus polyphemus]|uniref:Mediator of RNA polymerase II transcription subunit 28 n=1 Tax=Limulus polyphemus TaxID=6850 RepID=A0ABM1BV10_LIMPO|nr:mediator of RNA polymerase II transcription subunit 28-like [Limulus polyphemus]